MSMFSTTGTTSAVKSDLSAEAKQPLQEKNAGTASGSGQGTAQKPGMALPAKLSIVAALLCTVAVILVEVLGFSSVLREETANLIALPLLATTALFGGIQSYFRSQTVRSALSAAVFQFVAAAILYVCSFAVLVITLVTA